MITDKALNNLAESFKLDVVEIRLNGLDKITTFLLEEVKDNIYYLEFEVPGTISEITQLELLDIDGEVLGKHRMHTVVDSSKIFQYNLKVDNNPYGAIIPNLNYRVSELERFFNIYQNGGETAWVLKENTGITEIN